MPLDRASARLTLAAPVEWGIPALSLEGTGTIRDLSATGLCVLIDKEFQLKTGSVVLTLRSAQLPGLPPRARLRWYRRPARGLANRGLLCGAVFLFETPDAERAWKAWIADELARAREASGR
jgi:hypothetical protein